MYRAVILALVSALLLDLPFPVAGPLPAWRAIFSWIALVPLLYALLADWSVYAPRYLRRSAIAGYACGVLWYVLNCYWIYDTMHQYGNVPPVGSVGILVLYSMVLGLYFALFGFLTAFVRRASRSVAVPLMLAPFLWAAIELAASRITSVPWDQLGYAQVDNLLLTKLAPVTGVYGISFVLVAGNALLAAVLLARSVHVRLRIGVGALLGIVLLQLGSFFATKPSPTTDYAVLLQPNLDVGQFNTWIGPEWDENVSWILEQGQRTCTPAFSGVPTRDGVLATRGCEKNVPPPGLIAWPESPSSFDSDDPKTIAMLRSVAATTHAPSVFGMLGQNRSYNSGVFTMPDGTIAGRYDKIHLVPFGEYVPYRQFFFFAKKLTQQLADLQRGTHRDVFRAQGHAFGVFICYESIFADEIRQFTKNGADVFVNISDDGWYGDTSAPWQHLNMARMRSIENDRWMLLDTNNGVTTAIDPLGRATFSVPRHVATSLVVRYGYRSGLTFYAQHGDVFAILCGIITLVAVAWAARLTLRMNLRIKRQVS